MCKDNLHRTNLVIYVAQSNRQKMSFKLHKSQRVEHYLYDSAK